jgi:hypothetical protein
VNMAFFPLTLPCSFIMTPVYGLARGKSPAER